MQRRIYAPSKYIQGSGEMNNLPEYCKPLGKKGAYAIASPGNVKRSGTALTESFKKSALPFVLEAFHGECSKREIDSLLEKVKKSGMDVVLGIGGGKAIDTAKAVAEYAELPMVVVPTIASTDAPCSALSVIYTDEGVFESYLFLRNNPNAVIMDTDVIAAAPARLLVAGMGDALATYFEARACGISNATVISGGKPSRTALALARLCFDILMEDGRKAKHAIDNHVVSPALENVIEANTYLSGLGFESGGLAASHAIHNGLTALEETHGAYHGEKVAFGTLCQLILENAPDAEIAHILAFCKDIGLPTNMTALGVKDVTMDKIRLVAETSCAPSDTMGNMHVEATPAKVAAAICVANEIGK